MKFTKDNWIKAFENTRLVKMGGMCFECCDYEDMVDDMKAFISQVEKDAIEKTNKRWRKAIGKKEDKIPWVTGDLANNLANVCIEERNQFRDKLSNLLEDKERV